jgi:hypothetical protein
VRGAGGRRLGWGSAASFHSDREDAHAWHRLYWLLEHWGAKAQAALARSLALWPDRYASHPYTTSERLRVVAEVLGTHGEALDTDLKRQLVARLHADATWLARNVERHLGAHNHVLNNARALCAAGYLLAGYPEAARWLATARALWDEFWPQLLLEDGVFAEQSSHYHVMLTRTLLEYLRDAQLSGRPLPTGMLYKGRAMCRVTNLLIRPDGTLPLFGDISPDQPTAWLRGLPQVAYRAGLLDTTPRDKERGYAAGASAFFRERREMSQRPDGASGDWRVTLFPEGGLLFAENAELGVEVSAHGDPRPATACHGDTGRGSFEIWFRGRRVVVDGGVPTYDPGPVRQQFRGAAGQNVVAIGGVGPAILADDAQALPPWYVDSNGPGMWRLDTAKACFTWRGFGRCRPGLAWTRSWQWSGNRVAVEDRLTGWAGTARVEAWLHFGEQGWRALSRETFGTTGCMLRVEAPAGLAAALVRMPHATDYGVVIDGQGIYLRGRVALPSVWSWGFEFDRTRMSHELIVKAVKRDHRAERL